MTKLQVLCVLLIGIQFVEGKFRFYFYSNIDMIKRKE